MANPNVVISDAAGLQAQQNELTLPPGSLAVAENVEITRDGVIEVARGHEDFSENLPDFLPDQLLVIGDVAYLNLDSGLWYYDTDQEEWRRKSGRGANRFSMPEDASFPHHPWVDTENGVLYLCDRDAIYSLDLETSEFSVVAGLAGSTGNTDAIGTAARFTSIRGLVGDGAGNLFVIANSAIRKIVISTKAVTTFAGTSGSTGTTDGLGAVARFNLPRGITCDGTFLYVSDYTNHTIRRVSLAAADVTTFAGTAGASGSTDATGSAARFNFPQGIVWTSNGLYICDLNGIRLCSTATAVVSTVGGSGLFPLTIAYDNVSGACFFYDQTNVRLYKLTVPGHAQSIFVDSTNGLFGIRGIAAGGSRLVVQQSSIVTSRIDLFYPINGTASSTIVGDDNNIATTPLFSPSVPGVVTGPPE